MRPISKVQTSRPINRLAVSLAALSVAAAAFGAAPALAQSAPGEPASAQVARVAYDDETLRSFASAAAAVLTLRNQYLPRVRAAEIADSAEKAEHLFGEMRTRMRTAIGKAGFSEEQYRAISAAAKADPVLRQRINDIMRGGSPAQQRVRQIKRVTPPPPQPVAEAASQTAAGASQPAAPAQTQTAALTPSADDGARARLQADLREATAEQKELREQVRKLEEQLAAVKEKDAAARAQLTKQKAEAEAKQRQKEAELSALASQIDTLKGELENAQTRGLSLREQLEAEKNAKEEKLAAFRQEIKRLATRLASAQGALDALAGELDTETNDAAGPAGPALHTLTPLDEPPTSIDRVIARLGPQHAQRLELDNEIERIRQERQRREAERTRLQGEIAELSRNLAATYQAMAELIGEPASTTVAAANLDMDYGTDALDFSQTTAELFEIAPQQFDNAPAEAAASIELEEPGTVGLGDTVVEPDAGAAAGSAELATDVAAAIRLNPPPRAQIATISAAAIAATVPPATTSGAPAPAHQIVRDQPPLEPRNDQDVAPVAVTSDYAASVSGGVAAYRAADYREAYRIWSSLAQAGSRSAQFHLGALYFEGRGTRIDFAQAYLWLRIAAQRGDRRAINLITVVAENLTGDQIDALDDRARQWLGKRATKVTQARGDENNSL